MIEKRTNPPFRNLLELKLGKLLLSSRTRYRIESHGSRTAAAYQLLKAVPGHHSGN